MRMAMTSTITVKSRQLKAALDPSCRMIDAGCTEGLSGSIRQMCGGQFAAQTQ
jgi:hypothetical protein